MASTKRSRSQSSQGGRKMSDSVALADVIAVACAEAWRGDGEIFA